MLFEKSPIDSSPASCYNKRLVHGGKLRLITTELADLLKPYPLYSQENEKDPLIIAKFFDPCGSANWYMLEYDPLEALAFGYVTGLGGDELGYFSLVEMESIQRPLGLGIERDLHWKPTRLSKIKILC